MQTTDLGLTGDIVGIPVVSDRDGGPELDAILAMTRDLFPGEVIVRRKLDPEIADETYYSFCVNAQGSASDVAAKDSVWHRRLLEIAPSAIGLYRLSMDVR